jgi:hypothetical protein
MNTLTSFLRTRGFALAILAGALALAVTLPSTVQAVAEKPALPLKASFEKDTSGKNEAPVILHLKNDSAAELTVSAHIDLSVVVHNRPKTREVPAQKVAAGATLTIDNLAPEDKVTLSAEGHAPLVVAVPYLK